MAIVTFSQMNFNGEYPTGTALTQDDKIDYSKVMGNEYFSCISVNYSGTLNNSKYSPSTDTYNKFVKPIEKWFTNSERNFVRNRFLPFPFYSFSFNNTGDDTTRYVQSYMIRIDESGTTTASNLGVSIDCLGAVASTGHFNKITITTTIFSTTAKQFTFYISEVK